MPLKTTKITQYDKNNKSNNNTIRHYETTSLKSTSMLK